MAMFHNFTHTVSRWKSFCYVEKISGDSQMLPTNALSRVLFSELTEWALIEELN